MNTDHPTGPLPEAIAAAVTVMPDNHLAVLADRIAQCASPQQAWAVTREPPVREYQANATAIIGAWQQTPHLTGESVALAIRSATATIQTQRAQQNVQLVWTGPDTAHVRAEPTSDVVIRVINSAKKSLLLVSFANYPEPRIAAALKAALARKVIVSALTENEKAAEGQYKGPDQDPFSALDIHRYEWAPDHRPRHNDRPAVMHTKLILADDHTVFITSANLTGRALDHNMEAGVLVTGGIIPKTLFQHFQDLTYADIVKEV